MCQDNILCAPGDKFSLDKYSLSAIIKVNKLIFLPQTTSDANKTCRGKLIIRSFLLSVIAQIFCYMPKTKIQKQEILRNLSEKIKKSKSIIFAGFNAFGVKDNEELRNKLREENGEYYVAKKTLINLALKDTEFKELNTKNFEGRVAAVFSYEDEVAGAKVMGNFRKKREENIFFLGGILDGKLLSQAEVEALSKLPSKTELYAKIVGSMNAPISGFVNALSGNLRNLVYTLKAIQAKK